MKCADCGKPAIHIDLCHALVGRCAEHTGIGHQLAEVSSPLAAPPRAAKPAPAPEPEPERKPITTANFPHR